jgi:hypothetical protein
MQELPASSGYPSEVTFNRINCKFHNNTLKPRVSRTQHYLFEKLDVDPTRQRAPPGHQDGLTGLKTCLELFFASRERPSATLADKAMMVEAYSINSCVAIGGSLFECSLPRFRLHNQGPLAPFQ